jgi:glutamine synthetase
MRRHSPRWRAHGQQLQAAGGGQSITGTTWAPACVAHGFNNRTALVRTLHRRLRVAAARRQSPTSYLGAGWPAGGRAGRHRARPGPRPQGCDEDLYQRFDAGQVRERGIALLPQSLHDALDALAADAPW